MFEGFPYTNFHELNLDWIIKIAKDFLDQYSNIQQTITEGTQELDQRAAELTALLNAWYDEHSEDISNDLADAIQDLAVAIADFDRQADEKAAETIASIPSDYTALSNQVNRIDDILYYITERTANLFNPYDDLYTSYYADRSFDKDALVVTNNVQHSYAGIIYKIHTVGIDSLYLNPWTFTGTGEAAIRFGSLENDTITWIPGAFQNGTGGVVDVTNYDDIVVAFYSAYTNSQLYGAYIKYTNVSIVEGDKETLYAPYITAVDYPLRNEIMGVMHDKTFEYENNSLANTAYWEAGNLNSTTGKPIAQQNSIRTKKFIDIGTYPAIYIQAYYAFPDTVDQTAIDANYYMRTTYVYQYDKDGNYLGRLTSAETQGNYLNLVDNCRYVRVVLYTRYVNTDIPTIMPGTITFYPTDTPIEHFLPEYYDDYLTAKAAVIEQYAREAGGDGAVFAFVTDEHSPSYNQNRSPAMLKRLSEMVHIPVVFSGGDVDQNGTNTKYYCDLLRANFKDKIHHAVGNHDFLSLNTGVNLYYDMDIYNRNQIGSPDHHYYYVDDPQLKIRFIVLAAYMESEAAMGTGTGTSAQGGYTPEQVAWINDEALDIQTGYKAIVFTHYFYMINQQTGAASLSYGGNILGMLNNNPNVIAVFQGHTHYDKIIKAHDAVAGNLPIIVTSSDKNIKYHDEEGWTVNRASGTIYEQCFDVVVINNKTQMIHCIRCGGLAVDGVNDVIGDPVEIRSVSFAR